MDPAVSNLKRRRYEGDGEFDEANTDANKKRRVLEPRSTALPERPFACQFQKFDPEGESRCSLESLGFQDIVDVERHLKLVHNLSNRCHRCCVCFSSENGDVKVQLDRHIKADLCIDRPSREKYLMTEDMLRRFEEAKARESTLLWYEWMRIIVPAVKNVPIADLREMFTPWYEREQNEPDNTPDEITTLPTSSTVQISTGPRLSTPESIRKHSESEIPLACTRGLGITSSSDFCTGESWQQITRAYQYGEPNPLQSRSSSPDIDTRLPEEPLVAELIAIPLTPAHTASPALSHHQGDILHRQQYILKLRSELQASKVQGAQTRREIDIALDLLHQALDTMSTGVCEEARLYVNSATERLSNLTNAF